MITIIKPTLATINVQNNDDINTQRPGRMVNIFSKKISSKLVLSGDFGYARTWSVVSKTDSGTSSAAPSEQNDLGEHRIHEVVKRPEFFVPRG